MASKKIDLKDTKITVYEIKGWFGRPKITEQKRKFDQDCKTLLTLFAKYARVNKLPANAEELINYIGQSYTNIENTYKTRKPTAVVLDVNNAIDQLLKI